MAYLIAQMRQSGSVEVVNDVYTYNPAIEECEPIIYNCDPCFDIETDGVYSYQYEAPYFEVANAYEIARIVAHKDSESLRKYPAIVLESGFLEIPTDTQVQATLRMLFVDETNNNPNFKDSYQNVIYPKLYPIYESFLKTLTRSEIINGYEVISKRDIPFFSETKKVTSDYWDVIDLRIRINFNKNCKKKKLCI